MTGTLPMRIAAAVVLCVAVARAGAQGQASGAAAWWAASYARTAAPSGPDYPPITDGLLAWYAMANGAATNDSADGYTGKLGGAGVPVYDAGQGAMLWSNVPYMTTREIKRYVGALTNATLLAYYKPRVASGNHVLVTAQFDGSNFAGLWHSQGAGNAIYSRAYRAGGAQWAMSGPASTSNVWCFAVLSWATDNARIYYAAGAASTLSNVAADTSCSYTSTGNYINVACEEYAGGYPADAWLADVVVYSRDLSSNEVTAMATWAYSAR